MCAARMPISTKRKVYFISICVLMLQIISWLFASPKFYSDNFSHQNNAFNSSIASYLYWFISDIIILLIIPLLIIKINFKERIIDYGINFRNFSKGSKITMISVVVILIIIWLVSSFADLSQLHSQINLFDSSVSVILLFEILLLIYVFAWEFIWRGFMIFGLEKQFGMNVIWIQMIPFVLLHYNKNMYEVIGAIFGGLFLGLLSYKTRSIIYGVIIHYTMFVTADLISIARAEHGINGVGLGAIAELFGYYF